MPDIFITKNYYKVQAAKDAGFTTCSLQGSSRSGKTYAIVQLLCVWCHDIAKTTVSIIRAGMPSIKRTVYRDFRDVMIAFGNSHHSQREQKELQEPHQYEDEDCDRITSGQGENPDRR